jgi:DNA repair photolyase
MEREIRNWIKKDGLESYVLNSGNLCDSLTFEKPRPVMGRLIEVFREHARGRPHTFLIVTKGGQRECRTLFKTKPCDNVTVSFSVNNPAAARKHEKGAAPVADRLRAAMRLKKEGWRVRMRIDPMIAGYDYGRIIAAVRRLRPERVTLGTLRAERNLPRYTGTGIFKDLVPADNGKGLARYPVEQRLAMYRPAVKALRKVCPVGLCEETPDVWDALGLDKASKPCNCGG